MLDITLLENLPFVNQHHFGSIFIRMVLWGHIQLQLLDTNKIILVRYTYLLCEVDIQIMLGSESSKIVIDGKRTEISFLGIRIHN